MIQRTIRLDFAHRVQFTRGAFRSGNSDLLDLMRAAEHRRAVSSVLVIADAGLLAAQPDLAPQIEGYFGEAADFQLAAPVVGVPGGERVKNEWPQVEKLWKAINDAGLDRHAYVIAIGGGAVLDLAGFAAATAHRGIRHLRMPTTTLSQGDGGVGVKNGVNFFGKKNWVGTFAVPFAVLNDFAFLDTLPERERRAGVIEAIKVAMIRDAAFFREMEADAAALGALESGILERVIQRSAELHVEHIATGGDPFEMGSARPLDFGHWVAHKLEQISGFRVGHGEAVAIGMAADLLYADRAGIAQPGVSDRALQLIEAVGFDLYAPELHAKAPGGRPAILQGLEEFREHLGGELTITLVPRIGEKIEVHEMDERHVRAALDALRDRVAAMAA
ncbi:MAG: 3-dehydroquinate synthase [Verrucomicrobiales bacterium]